MRIALQDGPDFYDAATGELVETVGWPWLGEVEPESEVAKTKARKAFLERHPEYWFVRDCAEGGLGKTRAEGMCVHGKED